MHKLEISNEEKIMLVLSMRKYIKQLLSSNETKGYVPYTKLALSKLNNTTIYVDGGEMITFVKAVHERASTLYINNRLRDCQYYLELARKIDKQRNLYQLTTGPRIIKSS